MTEDELNTPVSIQFIRERGYCTKGTKEYWKALGIDFRALLKNDITVRDLVPYQHDVFVGKLITEILKGN
jgi:hypothetical protein